MRFCKGLVRKYSLGYDASMVDSGKRWRNAVACALVDGDRVLLQKRDKIPDIFGPGYWGLPGGTVNKSDETFESAVIREFQEETGYLLKNPILLGKYVFFPKRQKTVARIFYEVYDGKQKISCFEGEKMEFRSLEEMSSLKVLPKHTGLAKLAIERSQNDGI